MPDSERDTKFQNAAKLQSDEIEALMRAHGRYPVAESFPDYDAFFAALRLLLARRDYDLVAQVYSDLISVDPYDMSTDVISDLTAWPEPD